MSHPLAVICPRIGSPSETFIRRHVQDLCPGATAVVELYKPLPRPYWSAPGTVLRLSERTLLRRVLRQAHKSSGLRADAARLVAFLRSWGVRAVLAEYLDSCAPWVRPLREAGLAVYPHAHGYDVSTCLSDEAIRRLYRETLPQASGVVTMSRASVPRLLDLGIAAELIRVVHYGIDVPPEPQERIESDQVRCIAVGRMVPKKAPLVLLESFRQARAAAPQLRLDLIGDGELFAAAQQFVREHGLAGVVTLHGAQPNDRVRELMGQADLFLQHSMTDAVSGDAEGLPVAILEAMAHALPVVSTRHEGIPEAVQDGQTGLLVAESDSAAMAHAITGLARDRALRRRMGQAGWARCVELFSWQRERDELLALMGLGD